MAKDSQLDHEEVLASFRQKLAKAAGVPAEPSNSGEAPPRPPPAAGAVRLPPQPKTVADLGLSQAFLTDLLLKIIYYAGAPSAAQLVRRSALHVKIVQQLVAGLRDERLIEVFGTSDLRGGNYRYRLTERGAARAREALEQTKYAGPAPVTLEQYAAITATLHTGRVSPTRERIESVLGELVLSPKVADSVARALVSGKTSILYGPSGNGKSVMLQRFAQELEGQFLIPHAIYAYGQVIRVFDPSVHERVEAPASGSKLSDDHATDERWVIVRRPAVVLGAELGPETLDLTYDPQARFYQAPPHIKAQGGVLVVDDFGRQKVPARDLLTRWLIPLERRADKLTLVTGETITVPFHAAILFATNMRLSRLADEALHRRILYKVHVPAPSAAEFMELLRQACRERGVAVAEGAVEHAVNALYANEDVRPRAAYARDLIDMLVESAAFDGKKPVLDPRSFDRVYDLFMAPNSVADAVEDLILG